MQELLTMSKKELDRVEILQKLDSKALKQKQVSELFGLSIRQVQRLLKTYREYGSTGLISKKRGKTSNNKLSANITHQALTTIQNNYHDFGPTFANEKLKEKHGIVLSVETTRKIMIEGGLWKTRKSILKRAYQPRNRRDSYGDLIQIDGSNHRWFEERAGKSTLLVYVDDATSKLMVLHMAPSESTYTYMIATEKYISQHGKPLAYYSDKHSVFHVSHETTKSKIMTQFGRALYELNIELICANSSQAKGRVERANKTLQDRLIKELRLRNISKIDAANEYFPEFIEEYNNKFAKPPQSPINTHRQLQENESLTEVLCFKQERTVTNNLTIQYNRVMYLLEDTEENRSLRRKQIMLHEYPDGKICLYHKSKKLSFREHFDRVQPVEQGKIVSNKRLDETMDLIKQLYPAEQKKRSSSCPGKRHLGIETPWSKKNKVAQG